MYPGTQVTMNTFRFMSACAAFHRTFDASYGLEYTYSSFDHMLLIYLCWKYTALWGN